jgi:hypothetical protein
MNNLQRVNWGTVAAYGGIGFGLATSLGYLLAKDYRRAIYFFLGAAITLCVVYGR